MQDKIGKYEIEEKIGVGGFGVVFKGRDPYIKRPVAIKTCQVDEEEIRKRFFREAEFAGNLRHPNITTIYDFGIHEGVPFIVLEFLTGEDLDKKIKRGDSFSLEEKLRILIEVCKGLHYAHENNIIHRDIKPANIRIQEDGSIKIMDFGIAKSTHMESHLTQTGMTLGTAAYLAPEQIKGEPLDRRTDIFSLGVLMYEFFTYRKPFQGEIVTNLIYNILNAEPPPIENLIIDFPKELQKVVFKCLEKNKERRYETVKKVQEDLENILKKLKSGEISEGEVVSETKPIQKIHEEKTEKTPTLGFDLKKKKKFFYFIPLFAVAIFLVLFSINYNSKKPEKKVQNIKKIKVLNPLKLPKYEEKFNFDFFIPPLERQNKGEEQKEEKKIISKNLVPVSFYSNLSCKIYIDGKYIGSFPPEVRTELLPGNYEVLFKTDFSEEKKYINISFGGQNRFGHIFPQAGRLSVFAQMGSPYGSVYVNGKYIGDTPQSIILPVGLHKVEVKRPGYITKEKEIEIIEGKEARWGVTLVPENP